MQSKTNIANFERYSTIYNINKMFLLYFFVMVTRTYCQFVTLDIWYNTYSTQNPGKYILCDGEEAVLDYRLFTAMRTAQSGFCYLPQRIH